MPAGRLAASWRMRCAGRGPLHAVVKAAARHQFSTSVKRIISRFPFYSEEADPAEFEGVANELESILLDRSCGASNRESGA